MFELFAVLRIIERVDRVARCGHDGGGRESSDLLPSTMSDEGAVHALTILGEHLVNTILAGEPFASVKEILDQGAPVWYQNESEGLSPLHAAAYIQNAELVKHLIAEGAVWNARTCVLSFLHFSAASRS